MTEEAKTIVGRGAQLDRLRATLREPGTRVVTLRGPGGVGKTTMARSIDDAAFVELDVCHSVDDISSAVGDALGIPDVLGNFDGVTRALGEREAPVVVLDNAEHVMDEVSHVVSAWLDKTSARFLVTSRERLRLDGEIVVDVTPLEDDDALELFELRARENLRTFAIDDDNRDDVLGLISLVDGLPLAIELAAARTKILTPKQITERLGEQFEILRDRTGTKVDRHATLDACVAWSWDLLDDLLRDTLRQAAIFRGRFAIDEFEAIADVDGWVGDALEELVERSLLWVDSADGTMTFALYDSVRRYVDRKTERDAGLVGRYAAFLQMRVGGGMLRHRDLANIVHAFELCIDDEPEVAVELLVESRRKLWRAGSMARIFEMIERALAVDGLDSMWRAALYSSLSSCHYALLEYGRMNQALDAAFALAEGDERPRARRALAHVAMLRGVRADEEHKLDEATQYYDTALEQLEVLPPVQQAHLWAALGLASLRRSNLERAIREHESAIEAARQSPDKVLLARTLSWSSNAYLACNQLERAISRLEEALEIYEEHDDIISRAVAEYGLAQALNDKDQARALEMAHRAVRTTEEGRLKGVEVMARVFIARLESGASSASAIRRAMRVFGEDSSHNDRWSAWISLLVVLTRTDELDAAAQEAEFLVAAAMRVANEREVTWVKRYHAAIHAMRGDSEEMHAATDEDDFVAALQESLDRGEVPAAAQEQFDDSYMRYIHDRAPLPLDLLGEVLSKRGARRELRLVDGGEHAILPDGTEIDLETRYVLRRLLLALCDARDETPGRSVTLEELVELGWPDEQMTYESGIRRVYSAIRNLRKLGFEEVVLTGENGYLVDPDLVVVHGDV